MAVTVTCQCGQSASYRDEYAGSAVKCKACGAVNKVPGPGASAAGVSAPPLVPPMPVRPVPPDQEILALLRSVERSTTTVARLATIILWTMAVSAVAATLQMVLTMAMGR